MAERAISLMFMTAAGVSTMAHIPMAGEAPKRPRSSWAVMRVSALWTLGMMTAWTRARPAIAAKSSVHHWLPWQLTRTVTYRGAAQAEGASLSTSFTALRASTFLGEGGKGGRGEREGAREGRRRGGGRGGKP